MVQELIRFPKEAFLKMIGYQVYAPEVLEFHRSDARIRIPSAPARTSKSYAGAYEGIYEGTPAWELDERGHPHPDRSRLIWIVAPSYPLAKEFDYIWNEVVGRKVFQAFGGEVVEKSNSPNSGHMRIRIRWSPKNLSGDEVFTTWEVKSATNPESCQAEQVDFCIMSEAADQSEIIWNRYLRTRVGSVVMPTTPKITGEWLYELIQKGEDGIGRIDTFRFTPHCNPKYNWDLYWEEHALAESRVLQGEVLSEPFAHDCFDPEVSCKAMRDWTFAEQFGGLWTFQLDRALPFRWTGDRSHVLDTAPSWLPYARYFVSVDYGYNDPAVALWWAIGSDGSMVIYREIYERGLDPDIFVETILKTSKANGEKLEYIVGDPQAPHVNTFMRRLGLPIHEGQKVRVRDRKLGYMALVRALSTDPMIERPRLHVLSEKAGEGFGCPKTIHEWKVLRMRAERGSGEFSTNAFVGADHAFDAARYGLVASPSAPSAESWSVEGEFDKHIHKVRRMDRIRGAYLPASSSSRTTVRSWL